MSAIRISHYILRSPSRFLVIRRTLSVTVRIMAEGDTGAIRPGGAAHSDTWNRREKAAEDLYILEREKSIVALLREKIARQEAVLAKDRAMLSAMEDQYGHLIEGRNA